MKITFILPMYLSSPSGGFKVVYEYANRLQERGHQITVIHPRTEYPDNALMGRLKSLLWKYKIKLKDSPLVPWFSVHPGVRLWLVRDLREEFIPDADAIFATAVNTAMPVAGFGPSKGRKFYLVQSYETWQGSDDAVRASWHLPLHKIVVSKWLMRKAAELGVAGQTTYITLGLDLSQFKISTPVASRDSLQIGMLIHPLKIKGTSDGLEALKIVKERFPRLRAICFGTEARGSEIPEWIEYHRKPRAEDLTRLYNSCSIFLHPSHEEGWGLPPAEAMACGCAVVAAANDGVYEFAEDNVNALLAPVRQPAALARKIISLLEDDSLRIRIAESGHRMIQKFSWDNAVTALENILKPS